MNNEAWEKAKLNEVAKINPRYKLKKGKEYPYLGMALVNENNSEVDGYDKRNYKSGGFSKFKNGDIVFARITPCMENRKMAIIKKLKSEYGFGSTELVTISPKNNIDLKYLYYYLRSPDVYNFLISTMTGSTGRQRVPIKVFKKELNIIYPSLLEQKKIAAKLDDFYSSLYNINKLQQEADKIGENIINAAIDSVIGLTEYKNDHPKESKKKKLKDVTKEIITGGTPKRSKDKYFGGDIVWLRLADVHDKKYVYESEEYITKEGLDKSSAKIIPENSVILSTRATIGEVVIAGKKVTTNQGFKSFVCGEELIPEYLYYYLIGSIKQIKRLGSQTTYPEVSKTAIANFEILVPSLDEQKKIINKLNDLRNSINMIKEQQEGRDELLQKLPQSILKKAFVGEL